MRRQRFAYSLPAQDDSSVLAETDDSSIFSSHYSFQEPAWSQILSPDPEPVTPYCFYQYPLFQVTSDQYQSVATLYNPSFAINHYDNYSYFNEGQAVENYDYIGSQAICDAAYGDGVITEDYPYEEFPYETFQNLPQELPNTYPMVTSYGAVSILLRHLVRIDISPDKAVYVTNPPASCVASVNGEGNRSCVIHPNGRVFQDGAEIHMSTLNRKAKISRRGIIFTSSDHCLSYLVDASGTKTTAEKFRDLSNDFSLEVFYSDAMIDSSVEACYKMVAESMHKCYRNGDEVWTIGGYRIKQDQWGDVKVSRNYGRRVLRASPTNGQVSYKTPQLEMTVGRYPNNYFVVRKGDQQVTASLRGFTVQNGSQRAGFNSSGRVVLF